MRSPSAAGTLIALGLLEQQIERPDTRVRLRLEVAMPSGTIDKAKGRAKEAAGALTGDRKLKSEGKLDQAAGKVKNAVDQVADKARRALRGPKAPRR